MSGLSFIHLIQIFILFFSIFSAVQAEDQKLQPIFSSDFQQVMSEIQLVISDENTGLEIRPFNESQTFSLIEGNAKVGYLVPVKFNSKIYKNTICRLYFLSSNKHSAQINLFAEKNDEDDIVSSCVKVEAVSIQTIAASKLLYLAVIRHRVVNNYETAGVVVGYKNGQFDDEESLNKCIKVNGPIQNIKTLRKKVLTCRQKNK